MYFLFCRVSTVFTSSYYLISDVYTSDFSLCFFFQAEDGIRDVAVTGVQTCALPIYCRRGRRGVRVCPCLPEKRRTERPRERGRGRHRVLLREPCDFDPAHGARAARSAPSAARPHLVVPRIRRHHGLVPAARSFPPRHPARPPGGPRGAWRLCPRSNSILARPSTRAREPCPASPGHDLPGRRRGGRARADRLHLFRARHEPTKRLRGSRGAGALARRHVLLRVPRDRTLVPGDPRLFHPRVSFWIGSGERI